MVAASLPRQVTTSNPATRPAPRVTLRLLSFAVASLFLLSAIPSVQAANPAADLDQCANDAPVGSCTWQNGNLHGGNSHFAEGESVPYRVILTNLASGSVYTVSLGYDIRQGG